MLLVEQNVRKALAVADRGYVLERGRIVAHDDAQALLASDAASGQAYLGVRPGTHRFNLPEGVTSETMTAISMLDRRPRRRRAQRRRVRAPQPAGRQRGHHRARGHARRRRRRRRGRRPAPSRPGPPLGPSARRALLMKAAHALEAKAEAFAQAMARETGASALWAGFNVHLAAGMLLEAASLTTQIGGEVIPSDVPGSLAMALRQPAGVVLGIAPWNAPVILGVRAIAMPLACGNTVVLKGSEICPATHGLIVEALQEAGLPPGVVNFVTNAPADAAAVVEAMVAHPAVRRVNFTGSTHVGRLDRRRPAPST